MIPEKPKKLTTLDRIKMLLNAPWVGAGPFGRHQQIPAEYFRRNYDDYTTTPPEAKESKTE